MQRNRAEGWQHAKVTGHENESLINEKLENNSKFQKDLLDKLGLEDEKIRFTEAGGINETDVDCIFEGEKTKSKTDLKVKLNNNKCINISIKKSTSGQVYLITIDRFIRGFELQYNTKIPDDVKEAIELFWGSSEKTLDIIKQYGISNIAYQQRKHRLVQETLNNYDSNLSDALLNWFKDNIYNIADFCFSKGLAKDKNEYAEYVWYKNEILENDENLIININDLCKQSFINKDRLVYYGNRGGGTTIQLPFGFVQWHSPKKTIPGCMQFHHNLKSIKETMNIK